MNKIGIQDDFNGANFGKILCCDLDGVVLEFKGWSGANKFGTPIPTAVETLRKLHNDDWVILLCTSRLVTKELVFFLSEIGLDFYTDINGRVDKNGKVMIQFYVNSPPILDNRNFTEKEVDQYITRWLHNPPNSSTKPIASVYLDDMSVENGGKNYTLEKWKWVYDTLTTRFK